MKEKQNSKSQRNTVLEPEKPSHLLKPTLVRQLLPHIVAVGVFVITTTLYFSPMLLGNKEIQQSDIIQYKGVSKELKDFRDQTGKEALWTNSMFGGMPSFQVSTAYKGNLLLYVDKIISLGFPHPSELLFIALICFYILLIALQVNPWLAISGAIAYGLSSNSLILLEAGHTSQLHAIGLLPLSVAGVILLRQGRYWWGAVLTAIGLSLEVYANHLQITYYLFLLLLVYAVVELIYAIRERNFKNLLITGGIAVVCGIFSVVSNISLLWSTYDYVPSTIRGPSELSSNKQSTGGLDKDYAMQWSYGKMETLTLLIPDVYGGASGEKLAENSNLGKKLKEFGAPGEQVRSYLQNAPMYWGDVPFTSGPVYVGAIVCFLFIFGMIIIRERWKWWLLAASILAVFLAWGRNFEWFNDFFFYHFPGYNKFRVVEMALSIVQFTFPFMGFMLLSKIVRGEFEADYLISKLKVSALIAAGLCLLVALAGTLSVFFDFKGANDGRIQKEIIDAVMADRKSLLQTDSMRSLLFILLSAGLIWAFLKEKVSRNIFIGGIAVLVFLDLFPVGKRYLDDSDFISKNQYSQYFEPTQIDELILKDPSKDYRVFNYAGNPFSDSRTSYFHKSIGGYNAAKLRRYQEIIEYQLSGSDSSNHSGFPFNKSVIDMLNTRYIIFKAKNNDQVYPNTAASGNAWFVKQVKMVDNADAEMQALHDFNPAETAIIDRRFSSQLNGFTLSADSTANIMLQSYAPNDLIYQSKSSAENVAVFSEIYYQPGWDAFIDGKKTNHFRCDYILRGMRIPSGDHTIEFKFEPESFYTGEKIATAGSGLILLFLIGVVAREWTIRNKNR